MSLKNSMPHYYNQLSDNRSKILKQGGTMLSFFEKKRIETLSLSLTRDELLRRGRILIVDDEYPEVIDDLKKAHFSVDYEKDITKNNLDLIERPLYDLILLDFGNVGTEFGNDQGLSLLKHIKRVSPSIVVLTYTSKALPSIHADFYRMSDGVLSKDAGIAESVEKIENALKKSLSIKNTWEGFLHIAGIKPGSSEDLRWQDMFVGGVGNQKKMRKFSETVTAFFSTKASQNIGLSILEKLIELGLKAYIGVA